MIYVHAEVLFSFKLWIFLVLGTTNDLKKNYIQSMLDIIIFNLLFGRGLWDASPAKVKE